MRVIQRNLVYVTNISLSIAKEEVTDLHPIILYTNLLNYIRFCEKMNILVSMVPSKRLSLTKATFTT